SCGGNNGRAEGLVAGLLSSGAVHVMLQPKEEWRQIEGVGDHPQQELLPVQAQVSVRTLAETQNFRFRFRREYGHAPGAFDLVLPPTDQPLVMRRREVLQPERKLNH